MPNAVVAVSTVSAGVLPEDDAPPSSVVPEAPGVPAEDGAPVGPSESEEAAFLSEQREAGFVSSPRHAATNDTVAEENEPLPPLDDLVQRLSPATRQLLDDLFRAKFITVKRVPASALKE